MSGLKRVDYNYAMVPTYVKSKKRKPMPAIPHGEVLFENVNDYISVVGGRRLMFDKLTNLEVNVNNWRRIASARGIR